MFIYNLVILLYGFAIRVASLSNHKAKLWIEGRKNWRLRLQNKMQRFSNEKKIWVHCASLGEFEQGRPLIESIRKEHPQYKVILTFFSPSGYEVSKDYQGAEVIAYLPLDTKTNAKDFLQIVKPDVVVFIKYEFWVNFLNEIKHQKITSYLVSAVFKDHHPFFKWYGMLFIKSLGAFKSLFVQDEHSRDLLLKINIKNVEVCGDTRFDRVLEVKNKFQPIQELAVFKGENKLIVAGSTWPDDEKLIILAFKLLANEKVKLVIAPHEIDKKSIQQTCDLLHANNIPFSLFTEGVNKEYNVLILNTMGMLSRSYFYADMAYVGGGHNGGLHNILEPAVYRIPVCFYGNDFAKYNEATELVRIGAAFNVFDEQDLVKNWQDILQNKSKVELVKTYLDAYFSKNGGVTAKVMSVMDFG